MKTLIQWMVRQNRGLMDGIRKAVGGLLLKTVAGYLVCSFRVIPAVARHCPPVSAIARLKATTGDWTVVPLLRHLVEAVA